MAEELCDPLPDIHELFSYYNDVYFEGKLGACTVAWSSLRMSLAAGACKFIGGGGCEIRLSEPVLKSRTTADLKNTLLHEMIHAYVFSISGNRDHNDHGLSFQHLMKSINQFLMDDDQRPENGYNISFCHNFEDDMDVDQVHHWKCEKCGDFVKRSRNESPSASDCSRDGTSVLGGESCPAPICHWHMHETVCGGAYHKTSEPAGSINRHKLHSKNKVHGTLASGNTSTVGKTCPAVGISSGTPKKVMGPGSSLEKYFSACEKGSDSRHGSDSLAENQVLDGGLSNKAIHLSKSKWAPKDSEEETEILRFKRRRPPRLQNQEPNMPTNETITQSQMKGATYKKRQRMQEMQTAGKQEREPTVILAWKQWCMYEDEEDGEMIEALINKRDERRMSERYKKVWLQEHGTKTAVAGNSFLSDKHLQGVSEKASAVKLNDGLSNYSGDVTGSCTSESNSKELGIITALLPGLAAVQEDQALQLQPAEHATRSNTYGENDKEPGQLCDFSSELANCEVSVDTRHILNDAREGDMAQLSFSLEQPQMDQTDFSALEESTVVDPLPVVITGTPEDGVKTSDTPMVQQSVCTNISVEENAHGTHQRKSLFKGGRSCSERHTEELIINLDDEDEEREATNPGLVSAQATSVVDNKIDSVRGSNSTDNPNELIVNLPSRSRSQEEWSQGCEQMVLGNVGNGVCEEQGESTGGMTDVANERGKQKVMEISDEEEDSNRGCTGQQAIVMLNTIHSHDSNADSGHATTSGIEISNVCLESGFGGDTLKHFGPFEDYKMGIGAVESISPHQPERSISVDKLKVKKHSRIYHPRQKMQLGRASAGDDGGDVHGPLSKTNDSRSIQERGSPEHHQGKSGGLSPAQSCPVCGKTLTMGISNVELNSHIDQCLTERK